MNLNFEGLLILTILLLGLIFVSSLGNDTTYSNQNYFEGYENQDQSQNKNKKYDNYNHFSKSSSQVLSGTFKSQNPNGGTIVPVSGDTLQLTMPNGQVINLVKGSSDSSSSDSSSSSGTSTTENFTSDSGLYVTTYYGPNGINARVITLENGQQLIRVTDSTGTTYYTNTNSSSNIPTMFSSYNPTSTSSNTGSSISSTNYNSAYTSPPYDYTSMLPQGIPASQIPAGQEDLYILKSEVIPPVCPACPSYSSSSSSSSSEKCQPCPPCARCPEPSFECKKVPNYNSVNNSSLPVPALADFSTFGM